MRPLDWMKAGRYAVAISVAALAVVGLAGGGRMAGADVQRPLVEQDQTKVMAAPAGDLRQPREESQTPSYYQDGPRKIGRDLDEGRVEQDQDRYYKDQSENASRRTERMNREADKYYGHR